MRHELDPDVTLHSGGRVLIGGSPLTLLRLTARGAAVVRDVAAGAQPPADPASRRLVDQLVDRGVLVAVGEPDDPSTLSTVDVVVPVRDDVDALRATLARIGSAPGCGVTVVDDGSLDAAAVADAAGRLGARLLRHDRARGPGEARNTGARGGSGEWLLFVDAGVELPHDWREAMGRHLHVAAAEPAKDVGLVAPRVASRPGPSLLERYEVACSPLDLGPRGGPVRPASRVSYVPSAAMLVRRAAFDAVGGFDGSLRYGEDVDLVWRLVEAGWPCRYLGDEVVAVHRPRRTWRALAAQRFGYGTAAEPLDRRHPRAAAPVRVSRWTVGVTALAATGHPAAALGVAALTAELLARRLPLEPSEARPLAARLVARGHWGGARQLARTALRPWWPLALLASAVSRRARRWLPFVVVASVAERLERRDGIGWGPWCAARVLDDAAYSAGVWAGAVRSRSVGSLRPQLVEWPGGGGGVSGPVAAVPAGRRAPRSSSG